MKSRMRFLAGVSVAVGLLLAVGPLAAQTGALEGTVRDEDGKPLVGALVVIERTDMARGRYEVKTDKKGNYVYMGLPSGSIARYRVQLFRDGQLAWQTSDIQIPTQEYRRIDIDLSQKTEEQKQREEEMRREEEKAKNLQEHFNLGLDYMKQKQYGEAINQFEAAAALDPTQFAVFANLGQAYGAANQPTKSIEAYEKAISLKPDEAAPVHYNMSIQYARLGRAADAFRACDKAAELKFPDTVNCYYSVGRHLHQIGKTKEAIEPIRKAIELDPKKAEAYYWLGVCLYANSEFKQEGGAWKTILQPGTVEAFEKYLELEPNGQFAGEARQNLEVIEVQVPASVSLKKKKK